MAIQDNEFEKMRLQIDSLELRLNRLESLFSGSVTGDALRFPEKAEAYVQNTTPGALQGEEKGFESQIGRFGLAWMGNIVLLVGIIFLTQYLMNLNNLLLAAALGYLAALLIFLLAGYLRAANDHLSSMLKVNAHIILFYVTMRMHFFSAAPLISSKVLVVSLLILLIAYQLFISIRKKSQGYSVLAVLLALCTGLISDVTPFIIVILAFVSLWSIYGFLRFSWKSLLIAAILLTYLTYFIWLLGDPLLGHPVKLVSHKYLVAVCLLSIGALFSAVLLKRVGQSQDDQFLIGVTFTNGIIFTIVLMFVVLSFFSSGYVTLFSGITIYCLIYSIVIHLKSKWNYVSAFYALYGFMAMSIALYGLVGFPVVYLLLSVQSLLVVSMALWFRNKLIVIMNSILFLLILLIYIVSSSSNDGVNFSFALVALVSARIINWKKARLQIETDMIRNLYLIAGFIMVLYALVHAVPKQFVTFSWTLAALIYFIMSILLKNIKYRYMALGTMICAAFYLFIVDLARIEIVYRVIALLFLAAISIGVSIYYTNRIRKSDR